jgi:hypothetical protein
MPVWVEFTIAGYDGPDTFACIEICTGRPQLVRLERSSNPFRREIRQRDLRAMEVDGFVTGLFAGLTFQADPDTCAVRPTEQQDLSFITGAAAATL